MSSWVAPSVAAEIWGTSVEQILAGIADGSVQSYVDGQFLFVDLEGRGYSKPPRSEAAQVVTEQELAALTFQPAVRASPSAIDRPAQISPEEEEGLRDTEDASAAQDSDWTSEEDTRDVSLCAHRPPAGRAVAPPAIGFGGVKGFPQRILILSSPSGGWGYFISSFSIALTIVSESTQFLNHL